MVSTHHVTEKNSPKHATARDFCRILEQDLDRLYLLSFLLTAEKDLAEECFVSGLEDSANSPRVFHAWAHSWARRMIVQNAIQMMQPQVGNRHTASRDAVSGVITLPEISAIVELPVFERFVFVMSVLERYSDQDCALLLDCSRSDVSAARIRALQQIGDIAEAIAASTDISSGPDQQVPHKVTSLASELDRVRHFATSA